MKKIRHYVLGFAFNEYLDRVALIVKNKPEWQAGKYNGIGGKIEEGETPEVAMRREFMEEAGVDWTAWQRVGLFRGEDYIVWVFRAFMDLNKIESMTDESVDVHFINDLPYIHTISNLSWMIPLCLDKTTLSFESQSVNP